MDIQTYSDVVKLVRSLVDCPICKEVCKEPIRPKGCAHRYCTVCFKQCFKEKSKKQCATCRAPILAVTQRGYTQDELFQKISDKFPGLHDEEEEEFDLAAMMAKQQQLAAKLREAAEKQREAQGDGHVWSHPHRSHTRPSKAASAALSGYAEEGRKVVKVASLGGGRSGSLARDDNGGAELAGPSRHNSQGSQSRDARRVEEEPPVVMEPLDGVQLLQSSIEASAQPRPRLVQISVLPLPGSASVPDAAAARAAAVHAAVPWDTTLQDLFAHLRGTRSVSNVLRCCYRLPSGASFAGSMVNLALDMTAGKVQEACGEHVVLYVEFDRPDEMMS